jgi:hypothetical protein
VHKNEKRYMYSPPLWGEIFVEKIPKTQPDSVGVEQCITMHTSKNNASGYDSARLILAGALVQQFFGGTIITINTKVQLH